METTLETPAAPVDNDLAVITLNEYMSTLVADRQTYVPVAPFVEAMEVVASACDNPLDRAAVEELRAAERAEAVGETKSYLVNDRRFMDRLLDLQQTLLSGGVPSP